MPPAGGVLSYETAATRLDLVVLGRRVGHADGDTRKLSVSALGCARSANGGSSCGKTFKGMTDCVLEWQTKKTAGDRDPCRTGARAAVRPELSWNRV